MNLLIDIGNTHVKLALAMTGMIKDPYIFPVTYNGAILDLIETKDKIQNCIVVKSGPYPDKWKKELSTSFPSYIELIHSTPIPLEIVYDSKESLGMDRVASAIGGYSIFPDRDILVIDAGTAITVDFVSNDKKYLGGNIIPGMSIRFKALHDYTNQLPLVNAEDNFPLLGHSTETAIRSGVLNGILFELEGYIKRLEQQYPKLVIVMTGGDAEFFAKHLKSNIFVDLNLIFAGLNRIIEYNAYQSQNFNH